MGDTDLDYAWLTIGGIVLILLLVFTRSVFSAIGLKDKDKAVRMVRAAIALLLVVFALLVEKATGDTDMAWLIIGGIFLILLLALIPFVFSAIGLEDKDEALGLPTGSVRAAIALLLLLLFALVPVYLFTKISASDNLVSIAGLDAAAKDQFARDYKNFNPVFVDIPKDEKHPTDTFTVYYHEPRDPASTDFAKQMLVLLGTLATAVASFYFGAKTSTSATAVGAAAARTGDSQPKPVLRSLTTSPSPLVRNASGHVIFDLHLLGDNLNSVQTVKLVCPGQQPLIIKTGVVSNESEVKCSVDFLPTAAAGSKWDIIVVDGAGNSSEPLQSALTLP
jgi:hypothetical protein